jgi:hypothetical protein
MKDIIYSPVSSLILHVIMIYFCWVTWSIPTMILWTVFTVFYNEKRYNWRKFKKSQNDSNL